MCPAVGLSAREGQDSGAVRAVGLRLHGARGLAGEPAAEALPGLEKTDCRTSWRWRRRNWTWPEPGRGPTLPCPRGGVGEGGEVGAGGVREAA